QSGATSVALTSGGTTTINQSLAPLPSRVTGKVTDGSASGPGAPGVTVNLYQVGAPSPAQTTTTASDGTYNFPTVSSGAWQVSFTGGSTTSWYSGASSRAGATTLNIGGGQTITANGVI